MAGVNYTRQYETPIRPENWTGDAGRFYRMLIDVLDDIYLKYGRIDEKMLGSALAQKINSKADNGDVAEIKLEQGKLTASFTSLSGAVTQLTLDVDGLGLAISDSEQWLQTQIDAVPGQIKAAVEDVEYGLQSQIDLVPGQIKAEVSGQLANYTPTGIVDGSQLVINRDEFHVDAPKYSVNVSGTNGDMTLDENGLAADVISSPSVRPVYTGPQGLRIGGATVDGISTFSSLGDIFAKLNGKYIPYGIVITINSAVVEGNVELFYTDGAPITINASSGTINAHLAFTNVNNKVTINNARIGYSSGDNVATLDNCNCVICNNCVFTTSRSLNEWSNAFYANRSNVEMYSCAFHGGYGGLFIENNSRAFLQSCSGSGNLYGIFVRNNSVVGVVEYGPYGSMANTGVAEDSELRGAISSASSSSSSSVDVITTVELTAHTTGTRKGSNWTDDTTKLVQGYKDNQQCRGYMWFSTGSISGRTIKAAKLTLYRNAGIGSAKPVDVYIGGMWCSGVGYSISSSANYGFIGQAVPNESLTVTIPTALIQSLADGTYNGLYVYSPYQADYAAFEGEDDENPPMLTVIY